MDVGDVEVLHLLSTSREGLLTTYRRNGQPVSTPVSIAMRGGTVYFVSSATSGKARRLASRADVTLGPSTVGGRPTGPVVSGRAQLLTGVARARGRTLLRPGRPLFWSYLLYRSRRHRVHLYEVRFAERT